MRRPGKAWVESGTGMTIYGGVAYCPCGQEIWLEYLQRDGGWKAACRDQDGNDIIHCPGCGAELIEDELESL